VIDTDRGVKRLGDATIAFPGFEPVAVAVGAREDAAAGATTGTWNDGLGIETLDL
jgi:hypothetical protein